MRKVENMRHDFFNYSLVTCDEQIHNYHCHEEYEIFYLLEGENVGRRIVDKEYVITPHSILLIPGGVFHEWRFLSRPCRSISVHFLPKFLNPLERPLLLSLFDSKKAQFLDKIPDLIDSFVRSIPECHNMEGEIQEIALRSRLVSLLTQVYKLRKETCVSPLPVTHDKRILDMLEYVSDNLRRQISLDIISRCFGVSKNYVNVLFRKEMGTTFGRYLRSQRLNLARHEIFCGKGAEEAAYTAGFNDYSTFFRAYKGLFGEAPAVSLSSAAETGISSGNP